VPWILLFLPGAIFPAGNKKPRGVSGGAKSLFFIIKRGNCELSGRIQMHYYYWIWIFFFL